MADETVESTLLFKGDSRGAEKALDKVIKGERQAAKEASNLAKEAQKSSLLYADAMVDASRKAEVASKRVTETLKRQLAEQQRLNASAKQSGAGLRSAAGGIAGKLSREAVQGSPLAPVVEGLSALPGVGIAVGVAAAGAAVAFGELQKSLEKSREAAKQATERILENARTQDEINKLLSDSQYTAAQQAAAAELEKQTALQNEVQILERRRAELQAQYDQADLIGQLDFRGKIDDATTQLEEKQAALQGQIEKTAAAYTALNTDVGESAKVAEQYNKAVEDFVALDKERQQAEEQLKTTMAAVLAQEKALNVAYTKGALARELARGRADERAEQDRDLAAERAKEDLAEELARQEKAHQDNLKSIVQRGQDAIADVYAAIADRQAQAAQQIADVQKQYRDETLAAETAFNRDRTRALEDYQTEVARAAEDLRDQLRDLRLERDRAKANAILNNDVLAFLEAQTSFKDARGGAKRDFRRDSRRGQEDFEREAARAAEDFAREQEERRKAHDERISEIQSELAAFVASQQQKIAQIEAQTAQELELAQAAYDEQLRLDQEQRDKINRRADEDLQRSLDRLKQDREAEDAAARTAHTETLARIQEQATAQQTALDVLIAKTEELRQKALSLSFGGTGTPGTAGAVPVPGSTPYVPTPGSEKFYEDPGQGPAGQTGGGNFGAGLNSVSSAGGSPAPVLQFNSITIGGMEFVSRQDVEAAFVRYHTMMIQEFGSQQDRRG